LFHHQSAFNGSTGGPGISNFAAKLTGRSFASMSSYPKRRLSRTRIVIGLLLIVAVPIFIILANRAVRENAEAIRQGFGL
jgi:hypothetical protein